MKQLFFSIDVVFKAFFIVCMYTYTRKYDNLYLYICFNHAFLLHFLYWWMVPVFDLKFLSNRIKTSLIKSSSLTHSYVMISLTEVQRAAGSNQIGIKAYIFGCPVKLFFSVGNLLLILWSNICFKIKKWQASVMIT